MSKLLLHRGNFRQKPLPRNPERDAIAMREFWYSSKRGSHESKLNVLQKRYERHGWTREQIEDVVYYRSHKSLQDRDIAWSIREANF